MALYKIGTARKPTAELDSFVGEVGDLFYSQEDSRLRISDGETPGGILVTPSLLNSESSDQIETVNISTLYDLSNVSVDTDTLAQGDVLQWNGTEWIAGAVIGTLDGGNANQ
jgi:hypothetical protein